MDPNPKQTEEGQETTDQATATNVAETSETNSDAGEQAADADAAQDENHD